MTQHLKTLWLNARGPIGWMLLGLVLWLAYGHRRDHDDLHAMAAWVNRADAEIVALKKQVKALESASK